MRTILLLVFARISQAYDGCGLAQWRCGDVCITDAAPCYCGGQETFFKEDSETHSTWCCTNTTCMGLGSAEVIFGFEGAYVLGANCTAGAVRNLSEPCPNNFPSTQDTTIQTRKVLGGKATVSCNDYYGPEVDPPPGLRSYIPCWEPDQTITECIKKSHEGDGKYNCKSRSDENPFSKDTADSDPTSLMTKCRDDEGELGLLCGLRCLPFRDWCQITTIGKEGAIEEPKECGFPGEPQFFSNDEKVCSHPTFWRDKSCPEYRCNGAFPGQCGATVIVQGNIITNNNNNNKFLIFKVEMCGARMKATATSRQRREFVQKRQFAALEN